MQFSWFLKNWYLNFLCLEKCFKDIQGVYDKMKSMSFSKKTLDFWMCLKKVQENWKTIFPAKIYKNQDIQVQLWSHFLNLKICGYFVPNDSDFWLLETFDFWWLMTFDFWWLLAVGEFWLLCLLTFGGFLLLVSFEF